MSSDVCIMWKVRACCVNCWKCTQCNINIKLHHELWIRLQLMLMVEGISDCKIWGTRILVCFLEVVRQGLYCTVELHGWLGETNLPGPMLRFIVCTMEGVKPVTWNHAAFYKLHNWLGETSYLDPRWILKPAQLTRYGQLSGSRVNFETCSVDWVRSVIWTLSEFWNLHSWLSEVSYLDPWWILKPAQLTGWGQLSGPILHFITCTADQVIYPAAFYYLWSWLDDWKQGSGPMLQFIT